MPEIGAAELVCLLVLVLVDSSPPLSCPIGSAVSAPELTPSIRLDNSDNHLNDMIRIENKFDDS